MRKAFTLIEMVVALGILALVLSFSGVIFRVSIDSHRMALANAEIMQKLRVLTEQLDADFGGLNKDGEIFVIWDAGRKPTYTGSNPNDPSAFERFDRMMFFATGDFQTYGNNPVVRGNLARICYTLANRPSDNASGDPYRPEEQKPEKRILARTLHILVPPDDPDDTLDTSSFDESDWIDWNSKREYDYISLAGWKKMPEAEKMNALSVIGDIEVEKDGGAVTSTVSEAARGVIIDLSRADSVHAVFCEGVGQFMVQGWSTAEQRWIPQVNPNGDGSLEDDSDFLLDGADLHPTQNPGLWYPNGAVTFRSGTVPFAGQPLSEIPGLGRALKFTFTLYDSRGIIEKGRTFTHIVYLDS